MTNYEKKSIILSIALFFSLILILMNNKVYAESDTYILNVDVPAYGNAANAKNRVNSTTIYKKGKYYIFRKYDGVINISKTQGRAGGWINPLDNISKEDNQEEEKPKTAKTMRIEGKIKSGTYIPIYSRLVSYKSAEDALYERNPQETISPDDYIILENNLNMLKITYKRYTHTGFWINPIYNKSADRVKPVSKPKEFIEKIAPYAQELAAENDLYASVMIAQAALETGYGTSALAMEPYNNFFGIKGEHEGQSVVINTFEYTSDNVRYDTLALFRKYPSVRESLLSYVDLLTGKDSEWRKNFYYGARFSQADTYQDATKHLQGRYATSPYYANSLNSLIETYELNKYDMMKFNFKNLKDTFGQDYLFITKDVNVRDENDNIVYVKRQGQSVKATLEGENYVFYEKGNYRKIHKNFLSEDVVLGKAYINSGAVNIRHALNNQKIYVYTLGTSLECVEIGDYVYFGKNEKMLKVARHLVDFPNNKRMYLKSTANIRDSKMNIVDKKYRGEFVYATKIGNYYVYEDGKKFIWSDLLTENKIGVGYTKNAVNVRRADTNEVYTVYRKGTYVSGEVSNGRLYFNINNQRVYIYNSLIDYKN